MYRRLLVEHHDRVLLVRFDNPPRHFFDERMSIELDDLTRRLRSDHDTRAVVFTGQGQTYMTHFDVPELVHATEQIPFELSYAAAKLIVAVGIPGRARGVDRLLRRTRARQLPTMTRTYAALHRLRTSDKVVLTAVNGLALGMGCIFALACDIRLMAEDRQLGLPESGLGLLAGAGGAQSLVRMVGPGRALELLLEGRWLDASEAADLGLIHRAVPAADLLPETLEVAHRLATRSPRITREIKRTVYDAATRPFAAAARMEAAALLATMSSRTTAHRLRAYRDRLNTTGPVTDDLVRRGFSALLSGDDGYQQPR